MIATLGYLVTTLSAGFISAVTQLPIACATIESSSRKTAVYEQRKESQKKQYCTLVALVGLAESSTLVIGRSVRLRPILVGAVCAIFYVVCSKSRSCHFVLSDVNALPTRRAATLLYYCRCRCCCCSKFVCIYP